MPNSKAALATQSDHAGDGAPAQQQSHRWTEDQVDLIKETCAPDATDNELKLFLYQAQKKGLDPLSRQIHFVKRGGSPTIQTGIDGYRLMADRTGEYAGNDDYVYDGGLTQYEHLQTGASRPTTATATVYKIVQGKRVPFSATAGWEEYKADSFAWRDMPYLMLGKCAEALALRRAFPQELSGVYTKAEMDQAGEGGWDDAPDPSNERHPSEAMLGDAEDREDPRSRRHGPARAGSGQGNDDRVISDPQRKRLFAIAKNEGGYEEAGLKRLIGEYGYESTKDVTRADYDAIIDDARDEQLAREHNAPPDQTDAFDEDEGGEDDDLDKPDFMKGRNDG